tara:strand:- start:1123 stop:1761 length:639 start_codon:yes stop_codon:yes gene_type:complete
MKKIFAILSAIFLMTSYSAKAEVQFGLGLLAGNLSVDGTEAEGTAADTSNRSKSFDEFFVGADLFIEHVSDTGFTLGLSYVPIDVEIGSGDRNDSATTTAAGGAENDTGARSASADVSGLTTLYTNVPVGDWYGLLGLNMATIKTSETLPNSSYGNEDIFGYTVGLGRRADKVKAELSYTDFEDINISATGGGTNSISADADALTFRVSIGF